MKVVAFNGSIRPSGNTSIMLRRVMGHLEAAGIETELVQLGTKPIAGCLDCRTCGEKHDGLCHGRNDFGNECVSKALAADGILIGSPVYFADITANTKAFIERLGFVSMNNGGLLKRKVGAGVVAVRRGGAIHTFDSINHLFQIAQMVIPGSSYWNIGIGRMPGEVEQDEEGMRTMDNLGINMAWVLQKLNA